MAAGRGRPNVHHVPPCASAFGAAISPIINANSKNRRILQSRVIMGKAPTRCDARTANENVRRPCPLARGACQLSGTMAFGCCI